MAWVKKWNLKTKVTQHLRTSCPICDTKFITKKIKIVFRDVVECTYCGNIWILPNLEMFKKWTSMLK